MYNEELTDKRFGNMGQPEPTPAGECKQENKAQTSRLMDGMPFEDAVHRLKRGQRISRRGWNGRGQFVFEGLPRVEVNHRLRPGAPFIALDAAEAFRAGYAGPVFCLFTAQGMIQVGWLATQSDMQACDWYVVE